MELKNILTDGKNLGIAGGIISIISVFLPWYFASASAGMLGLSSSISVNGLGWKSGEGVILKEKMQSLAMLACGLLIIVLGVVNLKSIGSFSGEFMGTK
ncbi:MAG: hypothetical protein KKG76_04455 [Euryarchaeota archaeon]|nr:hypothetical protein [Euryarchaeota archaeon]MBU4075810.1 hypothetical protein [Euryarchaeota archaeon]MBU4139086.1 hypothetical protein [Euryarchaeota archaeon]